MMSMGDDAKSGRTVLVEGIAVAPNLLRTKHSPWWPAVLGFCSPTLAAVVLRRRRQRRNG